MVHFIRVLSRSEVETTKVGEAVGRMLSAGDVVALSGDLGSGKSVMARGILGGLGVAGDIPSPSFVIVASYEGKTPVNHIDLYRLRSCEDAAAIGLEELVSSDSVSVIEWADRMESLLPEGRIDVAMESGNGPDDRMITIRAASSRTRQRLTALAQNLVGFSR